MRVSAVIIAKNEAENLQKSLPKLGWCDEIIVVDDYSTDNTEAVSLSFGCKVFKRKFDGFGTQKRFGISHASHDWILNIDADEILSNELIQEIQSIIEDIDIQAYEIPIRHVFLGKIFKYGKESAYFHLRLFNRQFGNFNEATVHEKVIIDGKTARLKHNILHYSYKDLHHYFDKFNRYTEIGAEKLKQQGKKRSLLVCIGSFPIYFIKHYFIYRNFMNGWQGFLWSYLNAWYHTVKYLKLFSKNNLS
ncbi:MAG: glycosyltransferase family 2 protein [Bacteroidia bacterium]|nr:glycosyltransferase family 2 protein [Bacteroidia bacterium]